MNLDLAVVRVECKCQKTDLNVRLVDASVVVVQRNQRSLVSIATPWHDLVIDWFDCVSMSH
jgi:hypothetical protein